MSGLRAGLFVLVWFSCAWFGSWEWNPNNAIRLFAAIGLVERGEPTIDRFAPLTIDKARFGDHFYSDKAPGMTLMALPAVWAADRVTGDRADRYLPASGEPVFGDPALGRYLRLRLRLAVATGPALLTAAAAVALVDLSLALTGSAAAALFASLGFALGTPIWGWSTTIFGHAPVASLFLIAIQGGWRGGRGGMVGAGLALGWAVVVEHQAVLAGGIVAGWAVLRVWRSPDRGRSIACLTVGGLVALLPLVAYNVAAFGTPFRLGYQGVVGWEGMNHGLFGLTVPDVQVLRRIVFGERRGLLWVAPLLLLAPAGFATLAGERRTRGLAVVAGLGAVTVGLVNAAYVYWDGGNSTGPRLAMPAVGLLGIGLAPVWASLGSRGGRGGAGVLLVASVALNSAIASAEIFAPPEYRHPLREAVWPRFVWGDLRDLPGEWWGWSPWTGFALWAAVALPLAAWLCARAARIDRRNTA